MKMSFRAPGGLIVLAAVLWLGCGGEKSDRDHPSGAPQRARLPWVYTALEAPPVPADNPATPAKIDLGRLLFHDPLLSGDRATACVTCHSQYWGMGDGLVVGIGVGGTGPAGTGRLGPTTTRRNVLSLWNAAYRTELFWDGRVSSLEAQIEVPLFDDRELGGHPTKLLDDLDGNAQYRALFEAAFPESPVVSLDNLARAMASFVRTIVSDDAPYDRYAGGDDRALSADEHRGLFLFAELGCATCHAPPLFGADRFDAVVRDPAPAQRAPDFGRIEFTGDERDRSAFRVSQLRNVRETGPYFHDGHAPTLMEAIREMVETTGTRAATEAEIGAIAEFIGKGLMDKSHVPERPLTVPSGLPVPADGFTIRR